MSFSEIQVRRIPESTRKNCFKNLICVTRYICIIMIRKIKLRELKCHDLSSKIATIRLIVEKSYSLTQSWCYLKWKSNKYHKLYIDIRISFKPSELPAFINFTIASTKCLIIFHERTNQIAWLEKRNKKLKILIRLQKSLRRISLRIRTKNFDGIVWLWFSG